ncbi:hypothetical protein GGS26DRAFT_272009 [Hypomontagnella submonticulosa]|nr:hypothetical protein GGS26DRAFT_272009 [Hypomontagnella submonticulosa]
MDSTEPFTTGKDETRIAILQKLWPSFTKEQYKDTHWTRFFQYLDFELAKLPDKRVLFSTHSREEAIALIETIRHYGRSPKQEILHAIAVKTPTRPAISNPDSISRSLELAARLWLMINIDSFKLIPSYIHTRTINVSWPDDKSLADVIANHFRAKNLPVRSQEIVRIRPTLTMAYLEVRHGFQVLWTHNLADHLTIDTKYRTVTVYEHLICLWTHIESGDDCVIPKAILEEAIDTLNLLFPSEIRETQDFLRKHGRSFWELGYCKRPRVLELDRFHYWQSNVADLIDIIEGPAKGFQQLLLDKEKRNLVELIMFWIAVFVAFLTVFGVVFGTVSTVYSIKQYNVAAAAYALQLAQACRTPDISLPEYCGKEL